MNVNPYVTPLASTRVEKKEPQPQPAGFGELFKDMLSDANRQQLQADEAVAGLLTGGMEDVHQVMIATEKARLSLQLTAQVTNKLIEAYKDIARMQI